MTNSSDAAQTPANPAPPPTPTRRSLLGPVGWACLTMFFAAIVWVGVRLDGRFVTSRDAGPESSSMWLTLIVSAVTVALAHLLPPRGLSPTPTPAVTPAEPRLRRDVVVLAAIAAAFPFLSQLQQVPEDGVLWKVGLLLLVPALYLWWVARRGGPSIQLQRRPLGWSAAWALVPVAVYLAAWHIGPLATPVPTSWTDPAAILLAASVTAVTASWGEEVFYRYWLQSRLEAWLGRWDGLLLASLLFGLMHVTSHGAGLTWDLRVATVIAGQGVFGLVAGYLWTRYRRLWVPVLLHLGVNGLLPLLYLLGLIS